LHTQTVETCAIANPKSAYMLVYYRQQDQEEEEEEQQQGQDEEEQQEQQQEQSDGWMVPALRREVTDVEASLAAPILRDNQQHALLSREFRQPHLACSLGLTRAALTRAWPALQSLAAEEHGGAEEYRAAESVFAEQLCQGVHFVLQFVSKSSACQEKLFPEVLTDRLPPSRCTHISCTNMC
jgi:hypothetical protein